MICAPTSFSLSLFNALHCFCILKCTSSTRIKIKIGTLSDGIVPILSCGIPVYGDSVVWDSVRITASVAETLITLWTRSIVVQFSLLWDHGAASTRVNLLRISAPYLLPVHCHI